MKRVQPLMLALALFLLISPSWAEGQYKQERVNITIRVTSFGQTADDLREVVAQHNTIIQNLNLDRNSTSGNANLRVPPEQLAALVQNLASLGDVENQSQSTNDFSSSYQQYSQRMKTYQALQSLNLGKTLDNLPAGQREMAQLEFKNWLNSQLSSAESSLKSYQEQAQYAEVYLTVNKLDPTQPNPEVVPVDQQDPALSQPEQPAASPKSNSPAPEFFILCLINMVGLWLIYRKVDNRSPVGVND
jgi:Domain of unknown function (DUF4349)